MIFDFYLEANVPVPQLTLSSSSVDSAVTKNLQRQYLNEAIMSDCFQSLIICSIFFRVLKKDKQYKSCPNPGRHTSRVGSGVSPCDILASDPGGVLVH